MDDLISQEKSNENTSSKYTKVTNTVKLKETTLKSSQAIQNSLEAEWNLADKRKNTTP